MFPRYGTVSFLNLHVLLKEFGAAESGPLKGINIPVLASVQYVTKQEQKTHKQSHLTYTLPFFFSHSESKVSRNQQFVFRAHTQSKRLVGHS